MNLTFPSPKSDLTLGGLIVGVLAILALPLPAFAQIVPFADVAGYKIARIQSQRICFAAIELDSAGGHPMVFTYYKNATGQRWNVAGYVSADVLEEASTNVEVSVDGDVTLARETEVRDGDFMLPFEALSEIQAHEAKIKTGEAMKISINQGSDQLLIALKDHRAALGAIQACLGAL